MQVLLILDKLDLKITFKLVIKIAFVFKILANALIVLYKYRNRITKTLYLRQ